MLNSLGRELGGHVADEVAGLSGAAGYLALVEHLQKGGEGFLVGRVGSNLGS